jgi:hypothetical protein
MSLVFFALLPARAAERLAGTGSGPYGPVIGPPRHAERQWPAADACEEMTLSVPREIFRFYVDNAAFVHMTGRQMSRRDQVSKPLRGIGIVLVKIDAHRFSASASAARGRIAGLLSLMTAIVTPDDTGLANVLTSPLVRKPSSSMEAGERNSAGRM